MIPENVAPLMERFPALAKIGEVLPHDRVPFIPQTTPTDCGAACLAMILAYYGREARTDDIRDLLGSGRDGANALAIVDAASAFGLRARGVRIEPEDLKELDEPVVLHWRMRHFVVFDKVMSDGVRVIDPGVGPRLVSWSEMDRCFTGIAVVFEPTDKFTRGSDGTKGALLAHLRRLATKTPVFSRVIVSSILLQLFALVLPLVNGRIVDRVLPRNDGHLLAVLAAGVVATTVFSFLATLTRALLLVDLRTRLDVKMTMGFLDHLLRLPYAFFQKRQAGDLMMRVNSNATIREILTTGVLSGLIDTALVLIYLVMLLAMSPKLAVVAVVLVALQSVVFFFMRTRQRELTAGTLAKQAESESWLVELLAGIETLKATGYEHRASQRWASLYVDVMNLTIRRASLGGVIEAIMSTLRMTTPFVLLLVGTMDVMNGEMSLGQMLAANAFAVCFIGPVTSLVGTLSQLQVVRTYLARIEDVLAAKPEQQVGEGRMPPQLTGTIALERVSFRYGNKSPLVVKDVSLQIAPGEMFGVVGRSGCGKSTLAGLLVGLAPPTAGTITFDGLRLSDLDIGAVRRQMGVVIQKPYIFGATVRANIAMFDPDVTQEQVEHAAKLACIHEEISKMPLGYDTPLTAGGASLSGGQRQRIALARALLRAPKLLVLDEATSALDTITERQVMRNIRSTGATLIVIAHRLSTVRDADYIVVMQDGEMVEGGDHAALLAMKGLYAELAGSNGEKGKAPEAKPQSAPAPKATAAKSGPAPKAGTAKSAAPKAVEPKNERNVVELRAAGGAR
ncbi:MAG: peptidase domain-containing ABC transporter [Deltaproteobacteria bacterium]|nr:peptidase domain-containing ABC transporter [Deltaproteobacteria bacterium]